MKANQSVKNYPSKLRESSNYSVRTIKSICKNIGPREPGSENEKKAQEYICGELKCFCDTVFMEEFPVHPNAFLGWIPLCCLMQTAASIFYFFGFSLITLIITLASLFFVVGEFILYKQPLDPLFKKKLSNNVVGIRSPSGELKQRIIFSGHMDSSNEWTFSYLGGPKLLISIMGLGVTGFILSLVFSVSAIVKGYAIAPVEGSVLKIFGYILLAWIPVYVAASFFKNRKRTVMGANDNLTGAVTSVAVAKFMQDNDIRFENTEVRILVTGSEEAGLRGAKAYCMKHDQECMKTETIFCGTDTLKDFDFMAIYNRDLSGTVKNDPRVCALLKQAALTAGMDLPYKTVTLGASDAAAVTQAGIPAATLAAMDPAPARYYHTRLDTEAILEPKSVEAGLNILVEAAFLYDEQGLKASY